MGSSSASRRTRAEKTEKRPALTPAQWLPKPATTWMPQYGRSLRELWSPEERENRRPSLADSEVSVRCVRRYSILGLKTITPFQLPTKQRSCDCCRPSGGSDGEAA